MVGRQTGEAPDPMTHAQTRPTPSRRTDDVRTPAGTRIPADEVRARRVAREAERWLAFALGRTRMRPRTLTAKALSACAFSVHHGTRGLAVPSKLVGTSWHQGLLGELARETKTASGTGAPWHPLDLNADGGRVVASHRGRPLGEVQRKHVPWVLPLVPFGLGLRLTRVTGTGGTGARGRAVRLGCNVAFVGVGETLAAVADGLAVTSGDSAAGTPETGLRLVVPTGDPAEGSVADDPPVVRVLPEAESLTGESDDVVLWRTLEGVAHASVPHVVRHSPTGIEWGYLGSGPSDLALSVLSALAGGRAARALYQRFKAEVVARVPEEGGVLRAAEVRAWVERARDAESPNGEVPRGEAA